MTSLPRVNFGKLPNGDTVGDVTDAHVMTVAPTGAGKGVSSLIPNLLTWPGSVFVLDPKGENAEKTAPQRIRMGQTVHILDPLGITNVRHPDTKVTLPTATFNPLEYLDTEASAVTKADRLADTLILPERGANAFFSAEARALLKAVILHVLSSPHYDGHRHLAKINTKVSAPFDLIGDGAKAGELQQNDAFFGLVKRLGQRIAMKEDREASAVWSTLQSNLSQFDDPRISGSMTSSTFDFADLAGGHTSIYVVLPVQYLTTFNRWLRLLVGAALDRLLERMGEGARPAVPTLMVLDEFASLGNLEAVSTAYNLARGAGVKMWIVLQSISQLDDNYGANSRENFMANSGAVEVFGLSSNDDCQYFSTKMGETYQPVRSLSQSTATDSMAGSRFSTTEGEDIREERRPIMLPRDIALLPDHQKLLFRRSREPVVLDKVFYYDHPVLKTLAP